LGKIDPQFARNAEDYYTYCREHDIALTHAIGDPQIDRSASLADYPDNALRIVERRADGVVVRGAKQLATLAPYCHEVMVYMSPAFFMRSAPEYVIWFALPIATPNLRLMCRESQTEHYNQFRHDFSSRYDEQDAMLFFDDVFIPNHRIFLLGDCQAAATGFARISAWALHVGQIRFYHRLCTFLGIASLAAQAIGVKDFREIGDQLGELTSYVELTRLALVGLERELRTTSGGHLAPGVTLALDAFAAQISARVTQIMRVVCGSGLVMQPSEADLANPVLAPLLKRYMGGKDVDVAFKSRLFRLAGELVSDRYGMRQELYELWNRGDIVRNRIALYASYPGREKLESNIRALIEDRTASLQAGRRDVDVELA
jgi:aromatic ring hydroxylase